MEVRAADTEFYSLDGNLISTIGTIATEIADVAASVTTIGESVTAEINELKLQTIADLEAKLKATREELQSTIASRVAPLETAQASIKETVGKIPEEVNVARDAALKAALVPVHKAVDEAKASAEKAAKYRNTDDAKCGPGTAGQIRYTPAEKSDGQGTFSGCDGKVWRKFIAATPKVTGVTPGSGSAGTKLTINGQYFSEQMDIHICDSKVAFQFVSKTRVTVAAPSTELRKGCSAKAILADGTESNELQNAWTRTTITRFFLTDVADSNDGTGRWKVPPGVTSVTVTVIGAGGAGGRAFRTGGNVWGQGGAGGGFARATVVTKGGTFASFEVGKSEVNNPKRNSGNQCHGTAADGKDGGKTRITIGSATVSATGGGGGMPSHMPWPGCEPNCIDRGIAKGGVGNIAGSGYSGVTLRGGRGSTSYKSGYGGQGESGKFGGSTWYAPPAGGSGAPAGNGKVGGNGNAASYGGGGGGGGPDTCCGAPGGKGYGVGGNGEGNGIKVGQGGMDGKTINVLTPKGRKEVKGGDGGMTGKSGVPGNTDCGNCQSRNTCRCSSGNAGRTNGGGGGGLFGAGGGGGGDSCAAGGGAGGRGVIILEF